jgi:uncharacterized protein YdhG (YjbR/CyaY superfamily)
VATFASVDEYIDSFDDPVRGHLLRIRAIARDVLPGSGERIRYGLATVTVGERSVLHYGGARKHVAIYPAPEDDAELARDLAPYRSGQSTVRFPLADPLPEPLVARVVAALAAVARE